MKNVIIVIVFLFSITASVFSQNEKKAQKYRIKTVAITKTVFEYGDKKELIEEKSFDENGKLTEYKEYKDNKIKEWKKYTYIHDGNLESEQTLNAKGQVTKKIVYKYSNGLKISKSYYDAKDRLKKQKDYEYNYYE